MTRHYLPISIIAAFLVAVMIYWRLRGPVDRLVRLGGTVAAAVVPRLPAITTFLADAILLFSGATPPIGHRLYWVNHFLRCLSSRPRTFSAASPACPSGRPAP